MKELLKELSALARQYRKRQKDGIYLADAYKRFGSDRESSRCDRASEIWSEAAYHLEQIVKSWRPKS